MRQYWDGIFLDRQRTPSGLQQQTCPFGLFLDRGDIKPVRLDMRRTTDRRRK
jgi:hypothetical protein